MKKEDITPFDENYDRHGYWEQYYHYNGQLYGKGCFIHGKNYGYWEFYSNQGILWTKGNYINGKKYGYCEVYNQNGDLKYKGILHSDYRIHKTSKNKFIL